MALTTDTYTCPHCESDFVMEVAQYNKKMKRKQKSPINVYCSRACSSDARRTSKADKIENKRLYDIEYRKANKKHIKAHKAAAFKKDYAANPEKYRLQRKEQAANHLAYCQTPEYVAWKREYDQEHVFKTKYGESEWLREKTCISCEISKRVKQFAYSSLASDNRMHLCMDCESHHIAEYGISTVYTVTAMHVEYKRTGGTLTRKDIYGHPYLIEAYKFNLLLKRELR